MRASMKRDISFPDWVTPVTGYSGLNRMWFYIYC
jgi:hypothetical protein